MITPAYAMTATERVLPRLTLDFMSGTLDSRVSFARSLNTATRVNASGFIEAVNADVPRFDYDPITNALRGMLVEEARANIITYSQALNNWTNINTTVSATTVTSPDNMSNGNVILETAASAGHVLTNTFTSITGNMALSVFVKKNGRQYVGLRELTGGRGISVDLDAGVVVANSFGWGPVVSSNVYPMKDEWFRISAVINFASAASRTFALYSLDNLTSTTFAGDSTKGFYAYGSQVEPGSFATSYVPNLTTGTTSRNADDATMTGANFSDWWQATQGGVLIRALPSTVSGTRPVVQFDDGTANELICLRGENANPELYIVDGGAPQAQIDAGTISANTAYNLATAWNTDSCAAAINGAAAVADSTATMPTVTQARLGSDGTNYLNGHLQSICYWPQRIINAEVQAFSK